MLNVSVEGLDSLNWVVKWNCCDLVNVTLMCSNKRVDGFFCYVYQLWPEEAYCLENGLETRKLTPLPINYLPSTLCLLIQENHHTGYRLSNRQKQKSNKARSEITDSTTYIQKSGTTANIHNFNNNYNNNNNNKKNNNNNNNSNRDNF